MKYATAARQLFENGYAPAAIPKGQRMPSGPWGAMQVDYGRYTRPDDDAAVLTAVRPSTGRFNGVIETPHHTYISVVTVGPKWAADVDAIVDAYGMGSAPVQELPDGTTRRVFRMPDTQPFEPAFSNYGDARVDSATSFIALAAGAWRNGRGLLSAPRDTLPLLGREQAKELMRAIDRHIDAQRPATPATRQPRIAKPLPPVVWPKNGKLLWENERARELLQENGYVVAPVPWGHPEPTGNWRKRTSSRDDDGAADDGVGVLTAPSESHSRLVTVATKTTLPEVDELIAAKYGDGPTRVSSDGWKLRLFRAGPYGIQTLSPLPRFLENGSGSVKASTATHLRVDASTGFVVLSGADDAGRPYNWEGGDLLTVTRDALPILAHTTQEIVKDLESLLRQLSLARAS